MKTGVLLALVGLALLSASVVPWPMAQGEAAAGRPAEPEVSYGKALFAAKGCANCHRHAQFADRQVYTFGETEPPNLSAYQVVPEYVRRWLKDPPALKPATKMPNLKLGDDEIEALLAFLVASNSRLTP